MRRVISTRSENVTGVRFMLSGRGAWCQARKWTTDSGLPKGA